MALNTVTEITLPDGKTVVIADWTDIPYYSSIDLASGFADQVLYLFQLEAGRDVPYGASGLTGTPQARTATSNDTNIEVPGQLDSEEEMLIYAIKPEASQFAFDPLDFTTRTELTTTGDVDAPIGAPAASLATIAVMQARLLLQLEISEKLYAQAGFAYYNPGFGPFGAATLLPATASAAPVAVGNNGLPSQEAVRAFAIPHHIGGQEKFRVSLVNNDGIAIPLGLDWNTGGNTNNTNIMVTLRVYLEGLRKRNVG